MQSQSRAHWQPQSHSQAQSRVQAQSFFWTQPQPLASLCLCVALFTWGVYGLTLYRDVPGGDSGELILAGLNLGVAHPPGYPLYTLLAHAISYVPLGTAAARINALSALCDGMAAALLCWGTARLSRNAAAGLCAAGLFAFSALVWTTAVAAEVFALNNLFVCGLLAHAAAFCDAKPGPARRRLALWGCLLIGLGLCNHHTFVFLAVPYLGYMLVTGWRDHAPMTWVQGVALGGLGLCPYLYLPLVSRIDNLDCWASVRTLEEFLSHFLRREYGTFQLAGNAAAVTAAPTKLYFFGQNLGQQLLGFGVPLAAYGCITFCQRRTLGRWLLGSFAVYVGTLLALSNVDFNFPLHLGIEKRFWQQSLCLACLFFGLGWQRLSESLPQVLQRLDLQMGAALALVGLQGCLNYAACNRRPSHVFSQFAAAVLQPLPPRTVLLASGDHVVYALRYAQEHTGLRPDVQVLDQFKLLRPWGVEQARRHFPSLKFPGSVLLPAAPPGTFNLAGLLQANPQLPFFGVNGIRIPDHSLDSGFVSWPQGYVEEFLPRERSLPLNVWLQRAESAFAPVAVADLQRYPSDSWEHEVLRQYWQAKHGMAVALYHHAQRRPEQPQSLETALEYFEAIDAQAVEKDPQVLKNMGAAYHLLSLRRNPQAATKMQRAWTRYLRVAPQGDTDVATIATLIKNSAALRPGEKAREND